jgi:hypothetical protein
MIARASYAEGFSHAFLVAGGAAALAALLVFASKRRVARVPA